MASPPRRAMRRRLAARFPPRPRVAARQVRPRDEVEEVSARLNACRKPRTCGRQGGPMSRVLRCPPRAPDHDPPTYRLDGLENVLQTANKTPNPPARSIAAAELLSEGGDEGMHRVCGLARGARRHHQSRPRASGSMWDHSAEAARMALGEAATLRESLRWRRPSRARRRPHREFSAAPRCAIP